MPAVRVIGWTPLADRVEAALRAAGVTTHPQSVPPEQVIHAVVEPGTVDLVVVERDRELLVSRFLRRQDPRRPLVLVGPAKVERALRHAVRSTGVADGYLTWPADGAALAEGIARARAQAGQPRPARSPWERARGALLRWRFALVLVGLLAGLPRPQDPGTRQLAQLATAAVWMLFGLTGFWQARVAIQPWTDRVLGAVALLLGAVMLLQAGGALPWLAR